MASTWRNVPTSDIRENVYTLIGSQWMLITAGEPEDWNTMTASWGGMGVLWGDPVCFCFVRDSRYTYRFMNTREYFTLSFFPEEMRPALSYCGAHSGRDVDKAAETGLSPEPIGASVTFEQARLVFLCRTLYRQDIDPSNFLDPSIEKHYPKKDYHRMYVGKVEGCFTKQR